MMKKIYMNTKGFELPSSTLIQYEIFLFDLYGGLIRSTYLSNAFCRIFLGGIVNLCTPGFLVATISFFHQS
jgi:hypothetical protein